MNYKELQDFLSQCEQDTITKSYCFQGGDVRVLRILQTGQLITMKSYPGDYYETREQLMEMINTLKVQKQLSHEHLNTVIDYYSGKEGLIVFTEYSSHTLFQQIQARRKQNNYFSLEQIENVLISLVKALKYLQEKQIGHGCISTADIAISDSGSIKLMDPSLASNSPFQITHGYYYSPQLLKHNAHPLNSISKNSISEYQVDFFKNDIFVMGLVILNMGLLSDMAHCFDYNIGTISINKVRKHLLEFEQMYGAQLADVVNQMLCIEGEERITLQGILNFFEEQYEDSDNEQQQQERMNNGQEYDCQQQQYCSQQGDGFPMASLQNHAGNYDTETRFIENQCIKPRRGNKGY